MTINPSASNCPPALLLAALDFAARKHREQRRKDAGATPYINHPIAVAQLLAECGIEDPVTLQAAILHDTIEDTKTAREELEAVFGAQVASVVAEVTDSPGVHGDLRKQLQVNNAPGKSSRAAMVKVADKTCNLRDLHQIPPADWDSQRKAEYVAWSKKVVAALPAIPDSLMQCFHEAVRQLEGTVA